MWWDPHNDSENSLREMIGQLEKIMAEFPFVYSVGSVAGQSDRRIPLIVIDSLLEPEGFASRLWRSQKWPEKRKGVVSFSRIHPPLWAIDMAYLDVPFPERRFPNDTDYSRSWTAFLYELRRLKVPPETAVMFSPPPIALQKTGPLMGFAMPVHGTQIYAGNKTATLGFRMMVKDKEVYTTAGHLIRSGPCSVFKRERFLFRNKETRIGDVKHWNDPAFSNDPRFRETDVAIIEPCGASNMTNVSRAHIVDPTRLADRAVVTMKGGLSNIRLGWIDGAMSLTRSADGRDWRKCWSVMELDLGNGFAQQGDSGGIVTVNQTSELLGHVVCALGGQYSNQAYQCGYVQDIQCLTEYVEVKYGELATVIDS